MPDKLYEQRTVTADFEVRGSDTEPVLEGYAATFNQPYDLGPFREQIAPEAFTRTLSNGPDVRLLIDHEGQPLARTKSGTLMLSADSQGLHARAVLDPSDPDVQRLLPKMRRGDLDQMSFAFRVPAGGDAWSADYASRTIHEASLSGGDVSVVTYPANPNTSVSVRARDEREAQCVFAETMVREIRAGKTISAANMAKLTAALDALTDAHGTLTELIGEPEGETNSQTPETETAGHRLGLAQAAAVRLSLAAH